MFGHVLLEEEINYVQYTQMTYALMLNKSAFSKTKFRKINHNTLS
ncbi:hypothetical protein J532_1479 [Acinetobacter baumannii 940793]|nr:hypothetical protein BJAB0715_01675 [Acinetobacter baumannii BJAB0715]AIY37642.1 hypothetical protein ABLAC_22870 [Acinetobacter baumannii LAC-4]EJG13310.1 hypothetical protein ACIN3137_A0511 [Acinetobacter baumannii OIFC137]EJG28063.1 hypothetical protein ACIN5109_3475 [Acinetobacter baumannii OIFC109]EJO42125.1 hypothetical protein ACINIS123_2964 [Acinetobacter baumannii IS-123]EJP59563.1 hypothetical protein ACINNAV81_0507 [Acinetobacter baumannii Naval-81]EKL53099.1 hypothetical protei